MTRKYAVEKTSLIVGVNVTVIVDVAPGIRSALMWESYKLLSFPSSDTLSILNWVGTWLELQMVTSLVSCLPTRRL